MGDLAFYDPNMAQQAMNTLFGVFDETTQVQKLAATEQLSSMEMSNEQKLLHLEQQKQAYNQQQAFKRDMVHGIRKDARETTEVLNTLYARKDYGQMVRVYGRFLGKYGLEQNIIDMMDADQVGLDPQTAQQMAARKQAVSWMRENVPGLRHTLNGIDQIISTKEIPARDVYGDSWKEGDPAMLSVLDAYRDAMSGDSEKSRRALNYFVRGTDPSKKSMLARDMGAMYIQDPLFFNGEGTAVRVHRDPSGRIIPNLSSPQYQEYVSVSEDLNARIASGGASDRATAKHNRDTEIADFNRAKARNSSLTFPVWQANEAQLSKLRNANLAYEGWLVQNASAGKALSSSEAAAGWNRFRLLGEVQSGNMSVDQMNEEIERTAESISGVTPEVKTRISEIQKRMSELQGLFATDAADVSSAMPAWGNATNNSVIDVLNQKIKLLEESPDENKKDIHNLKTLVGWISPAGHQDYAVGSYEIAKGGGLNPNAVRVKVTPGRFNQKTYLFGIKGKAETKGYVIFKNQAGRDGALLQGALDTVSSNKSSIEEITSANDGIMSVLKQYGLEGNFLDDSVAKKKQGERMKEYNALSVELAGLPSMPGQAQATGIPLSQTFRTATGEPITLLTENIRGSINISETGAGKGQIDLRAQETRKDVARINQSIGGTTADFVTAATSLTPEEITLVQQAKFDNPERYANADPEEILADIQANQ